MPMAELTTDELVVLQHKTLMLKVRALLLCSVLAILAPWYLMLLPQVFRHYKTAWVDLLIPLFFCPLWLPALWAAWKLGEKNDIRRITSAFSLASGWSLFVAGLSLFVLAATISSDINFGEAIFPLTVLCLQFGLLPYSVRGYRRILLAYDEKAWPWTGLGAGFCAVIPFLVIVPNLLGERHPYYEAPAVGSLRTISMAQMDYDHLHPQTGFAVSLLELGPASGENLIDQTLAGGKKAAYLFTLKPGVPDIEGRVANYAVTATPTRFKEQTSRSFFMDESSLIHYTKEHRPATVQDPLLQ